MGGGLEIMAHRARVMGGSLLGRSFRLWSVSGEAQADCGGKGESVVLLSVAAGSGSRAGAWATFLTQLLWAILSQFFWTFPQSAPDSGPQESRGMFRDEGRPCRNAPKHSSQDPLQ